MQRVVTNLVRQALDDWLPPVLRESVPFGWLAKAWLGPQSIPDFKYRAFRMSDQEFSRSCGAVTGLYAQRASDTTEQQARWILDRVQAVTRAGKILEVGPGAGRMTRLLRELGHEVVTLDLTPSGDHGAVVGVLERMPFAAGSFDLVVAAHVIEHVRSLTKACLELARVSSRPVLLVTPRQRFYRYTFDYHLHFFYSLDHLASFLPDGTAEGKVLDRDFCLEWRPSGSGAPVRSS